MTTLILKLVEICNKIWRFAKILPKRFFYSLHLTCSPKIPPRPVADARASSKRGHASQIVLSVKTASVAGHSAAIAGSHAYKVRR